MQYNYASGICLRPILKLHKCNIEFDGGGGYRYSCFDYSWSQMLMIEKRRGFMLEPWVDR